MPENHQITKRDLLEMLQPFDDHDKIAIVAEKMPVDTDTETDDDGKVSGVKVVYGEMTLFIDKVVRTNGKRTSILIKAYEA